MGKIINLNDRKNDKMIDDLANLLKNKKKPLIPKNVLEEIRRKELVKSIINTTKSF